MNQSKLVGIIAIVFASLFILAALSQSLFITLDPGEQGVLFKRFGGGLDTKNMYDQGFHVIAPWNKMYVYDIRTQESFEKMEVLSKNGLTIKVDLSYRYSPVKAKVGELHNDIGPEYQSRIIIPEIRSATREVIGKYLPEELYSSKREAIQDEIFNRTKEAIGEKYLVCDAVLIREVELPQTLKDAIERKLKQEQESLEYEFRLEKERKEAQRKIIEAEAKAASNNLLNASLTNNILRDKGIEATLELANSPNSKVIVVGGGDEGLPLILGN